MKTLRKILLSALLMCATDCFAAQNVALPTNAAEQALACKREGDQLLKSGNLEEAIAAYQKALASDAGLSAAWFNLAIARYAKRDLEGTIEALEQVIRFNGNDSEALYNLGCVWLYQGNAQEARKHFDRAARCPCVEPLVAEQIGKAAAYLRFYENCTPSQRSTILRLLQDGLEPLTSA